MEFLAFNNCFVIGLCILYLFIAFSPQVDGRNDALDIKTVIDVQSEQEDMKLNNDEVSTHHETYFEPRMNGKSKNAIDEIELMYKKQLDVSDNAGHRNKRSSANKMADYLVELYAAMKEEDNVVMHREKSQIWTDLPTIRSLKPSLVRRTSPTGASAQFLFTSKELSSTSIRRAEIVLHVRSLSTKQNTSYTDTITLNVETSEMGKYQFSAKRYKDFFIFDITSIKTNIHRNVFIYNIIMAGHSKLRYTKASEPLLVLFENMNENPILKGKRGKRNVRDRVPFYGLPEQDTFEFYHCNRYTWYIDMKSFHWDWLIEPNSYNAGYCSGECPAPLASKMLNTTNYSFIKNLWHIQNNFTDEYVPKACCTPIAYYDETLLYLSKAEAVVLTRLPNMRVADCGCR